MCRKLSNSFSIKLKLNLIRNKTIAIQQNECENDVCNMAAILRRCVHCGRQHGAIFKVISESEIWKWRSYCLVIGSVFIYGRTKERSRSHTIATDHVFEGHQLCHGKRAKRMKRVYKSVRNRVIPFSHVYSNSYCQVLFSQKSYCGGSLLEKMLSKPRGFTWCAKRLMP